MRKNIIWKNVEPTQWSDWRWQLQNRIGTVDELQRVLNLSESERLALQNGNTLFRTDITPYFASLMDPDDYNCPLRRQVVPTEDELSLHGDEKTDPLDEERDSPVPGLMHRYPDRVAMLITMECASYCRFCTRSRIVGKPHENAIVGKIDAGIEYIKRNPAIRDVLLTGGDPVLASEELLVETLRKLKSIAHVEIVRFSTRLPVFLPQRITHSLVEKLKPFQPIWINININHPKEVTKEAECAIATLADHGFPLGAQTVLMSGINDCPVVMRTLMQKLIKNRIRPYYLYVCDLTRGTGRFRTPITVGLSIIEHLRGHTTGFAVPSLVVDLPNGGGKVPVTPNYIVTSSFESTVLRNFEGLLSSYPTPVHYKPHDKDKCENCRKETKYGVASLLDGGTGMIAPKGWPGNRRGMPTSTDPDC